VPAKLIILGTGELLHDLKECTSDLRLFDAVDFVGFQQNPFAWFAAADVYALSSRAEGLSNVLTEALALGCRIVSTNCPSGPAEVLANGKYGRLTPVGDYNAFAKAISETLAGENLPPGTAAELENHMQAFSLKQMVDTYVQYFELAPPPITYRAAA
jgi:glycosyltransferase involved in cell wall biosynthesis